MTGGKRPGAGRPATPLDEKRIATLHAQGMNFSEIGRRFGIAQHIIKRRIHKLKAQRVINDA